ncbi:hypothetical protein HHE94_11970 [Pseudoalteromonas arctica]|uniref:C-methyltransferase domain-containing protein n=1 Tax=Pseudoalteromonas arctica TaxID=394751 RepID=A0AAP6Y674_9GAMM|nr:hypothetical protein [Pseudoalteromonas arctica]NMP03418.1 hypothetical protein [Pseudoalteromonas arctica]
MKSGKKYIIFAPIYNENVGGAIAMHRLCHLINKLGGEAYLWHDGKSSFKTCETFDTPTIFTKNLHDYIVVYMDVVSGNPLSCPHVVRWFLNKPGFFTGKVNYGENELYFRFQDAFFHEHFYSQKLYVAYFVKQYYFNKKYSNRSGSCYMMRKGRGRKIEHDLKNSTLIDDLSHKETAEVFNRSKYFYCYDLYSAYSSFAVLCGCIPIVIPQVGLSEKDWQGDTRLRYGIAYGKSEKQLSYAKNTARNLTRLIEDLELESEKHVENFIFETQRYFSLEKKSKSQIESEKPTFYNKLKNSKNKIVLFGASESLRILQFSLEIEKIDWHYIADNNPEKSGGSLFNRRVFLPQDLFSKEEQFDVLIVSAFHEEIKSQLVRYENIKYVYSVYD